MTIVEHIATAADLERLPDDGFRYELVRGEVRKMTPAGNEHGKIAMSVAWRLAQHVENHGLGSVYAAETGFRLAADPDTVRAPDAAFVSQARLERWRAIGRARPIWRWRWSRRGIATGRSRKRWLLGWRQGRRWWLSSSRSSGRWRCIGLRVLWMYCEKAMCWKAGRWCRDGRYRSRRCSPSGRRLRKAQYEVSIRMDRSP